MHYACDSEGFDGLITLLDQSNTLSLSLFPIRPAPPTVHLYHVPLSVVTFQSLHTSAWDLTIQRILPHINGINSVARISQITDTDVRLARRAIQHLVYYDCVLLLDMFSFSAIYAPTPALDEFIKSHDMQDECRRYVFNEKSPFKHKVRQHEGNTNAEDVQQQNNSGPSSGREKKRQSLLSAASDDSAKLKRSSLQSRDSKTMPAHCPVRNIPTRMQIIDLYALFRQGLTLRDYCFHRSASLHNIDVRRLVTFGVIKGFLYRVHKYALRSGDAGVTAAELTHTVPEVDARALASSDAVAKAAVGESALADFQRKDQRKAARVSDQGYTEEEAWRSAALSSGWRLPAAHTLLPSHPLITATGRYPATLSSADMLPAATHQGTTNKASVSPRPPGTADGTITSETTTTTTTTTTTAGSRSSIGTGAMQRRLERENKEMLRFADGLSCFDEICLELGVVEGEALDRFKAASSSGSDIVVIAR